MGTRGTYGFRKGGKDKLTYNHYDSYPSGLGQGVVNFARATPIQELNAIYDRIIMVNEDTPPTQEQVEECLRFTDLDVSSRSSDDWYCLMRLAQGNLMVYREMPADKVDASMKAAADAVFPEVRDGKFICMAARPAKALRYMLDDGDFIKDSLFCEYGYIINLDTNELEYWVGFQRTPQKDNRYGTEPHGPERGYYPCVLAGRWPLDNLPDDIITQMTIIDEGHAQSCVATTGGEWSGHPDPADPDNRWVCDNCGGNVPVEEDE